MSKNEQVLSLAKESAEELASVVAEEVRECGLIIPNSIIFVLSIK